MRSIRIIVLTSVFFAVFTWAQDAAVPAPIRVMQIHLKDGSVDSLFCDQINPGYGIMFAGSDKGYEMKVTFLVVDSTLMPIQIGVDPVTQAPVYENDERYYYTSLIDSITFPLYIP
jgi:hypothetical protein